MPASPDLSFLILGATGYVGGAIALEIKKKYPSATLVAHTRSEGNASALIKAGLKPLVGSADTKRDLELIRDTVKASDVVLNCADADSLPLTEAILSGLEQSQKKLPVLIHTSGTGVVADKPTGSFQDSAKKIWDDIKVDDIKAIGPSQPHRAIDLAIFDAAKKGHSIHYIVAPSTIYGVAFDNPVHKISQQVPSLIRIALKKRQSVYGGEGTNLWNNVHIYDLADLYLIILDKALVERASGINPQANAAALAVDPFERWYFGSVGEHQWGDVPRKLGPLLHARGLVDTPRAVSVPAEEVSSSTATNSRSVANRGFKDGWKPNHPSLEATLEEDIDGVLEKDGLKN